MNIITRFKNVMGDPTSKKSVSRIVYEGIVWMLVHKELPRHYFGHRLYHKDGSSGIFV